ncbi:MAG: hypothetical protein IT376_21050 [Polyangiaceae bacterium]|nr:hypothetical protein [Polyangiaceae bacterium]
MARWKQVVVAIVVGCSAAAVAAGGARAEGAEPSAASRAVVVSDALPDATENAKLRAAVYELLRGRGMTPDPKADVMAAATSSGAVEDAKITADPARLSKLRQALGAAVLVRLSREWERGGEVGVRVSASGPRGDESRVVAVSGGDAKPVQAMVAELLDLVAPAEAPARREPARAEPARPEPAPSARPPRGEEPAPEPESREPPGGARASRSEGALEEERPELALGPRWEGRGGLRPSLGALVVATAHHDPEWEFSDTERLSQQRYDGIGPANGIGGGLGVRVGVMYLSLPDPTTKSGSFAAFRVNAGADANVLFHRRPSEYKFAYDPNGAVIGKTKQEESKALFVTNVPLEVGLGVGFGRYRTETIWRGVIVGLMYVPTYTYTLEIGADVGAGRFNFAGFGGWLDIVALEASDDTSRSDAAIRLTAYVLPRVTEEHPWIVSAGIGAIWY